MKKSVRIVYLHVLVCAMVIFFVTSCDFRTGKETDCTTAKDKVACCKDSTCANGCRTVKTLCTCTRDHYTCSYVVGYDGNACIPDNNTKTQAVACCKKAADASCYGKLSSSPRFGQDDRSEFLWEK